MRFKQCVVLCLASLSVACGGGGGSDGPVTGPATPVTGEPTPTPVVTIDAFPASRGLLPDIARSQTVFSSEHYSGSGTCEECHTDFATGDDRTMVVFEEGGARDLSIGNAWRTSMMANSARDPYWHAVLASELDRFPTLHEEINDTCTRCHAPMVNDYARKEGLPIQVLDEVLTEDEIEQGVEAAAGFIGKDDQDVMFNHAMDGVSCSLCHQMADDGNLGTDAGMSGGWVVNFFPDADFGGSNFGDRPAFGQYSDLQNAGFMLAKSGYTPVFGAHISSSETCGSCHNLQTNPVTEDGEPVPDVSHFAEQMVYTEWQNSIFDDAGSNPKSCQDCHMPTVDQPVPLLANGELFNDFAEHTFLGANTVMQDMIKNFKDELGVPEDISEADFDESIARNREFLKTSAIIELKNAVIAENELSLDVEITNMTGHKLPSGYHSRRAYLHVLVTDNNGQVVYENGRIRPDGSIDGVSQDANPDSFEVHYDRITSATQVQVYQAIPGDSNGVQTESLLAATQFLKDNRLTPAGFNKASVPDDVAVHGAALNDANFDSGKDTVTYVIPTPSAGPYNVLVELRYQPLSYGSLQALFAESGRIDQVDMFRTIYDATSLRDEIIATSVLTVQ